MAIGARLTGIALLGVLAGCGTAVTPLERGLSLYDKGYYTAAVSAFDEAVQQSPDSAAAWTNRGVARIRTGDVPGAISDFTQALELTPDDPELLFNRGNAHMLADNPTAAIADFTRAIEVNSDFAPAVFNRGLAHSRVGDADGAQADFAQAIALELDPRAREAMKRSANVAAARAGRQPARLGLSSGGSSSVEAPPDLPVEPAPTSPAETPPAETPPATEASAPTPSAAARLDARTLADRGLDRELSGDRAGALADLRAALTLEADPGRRAGIENLLRLLERD